MFEIGDAVVHPAHGAGVVIDLEERQPGGTRMLYYKIKPLACSGLTLMVPVGNAERIGLRATIPESELDGLWDVLTSRPETLPENHTERRKLLESKLRRSEVYHTAEVVRDLVWRQQQCDRLTDEGAQLLEKGVQSLACEIAATRGTDTSEAETQVWARLEDSMRAGMSDTA